LSCLLTVPPELTGIIASWSFIPESIRDAVTTILAPYLIDAAGKGNA
jgi:hypothetical protein